MNALMSTGAMRTMATDVAVAHANLMPLTFKVMLPGIR